MTLYELYCSTTTCKITRLDVNWAKVCWGNLIYGPPSWSITIKNVDVEDH